ncbi:MAG: hypothetical protein LBC80_04180 [Treponema sp.]|nr:hypothetical protein [Treponema sp.]
MHVTPPEIGLARRFFGNATGNYEFKDGRLIITGAMSTGTGGMTTTARNYHLVYVTKPVKASAAYAVEVDIVMPGGTAPVSNIFDHANSLIGLAAIKGNPATQTADQLGYWLLAHRSLTAAPPRMRKPAGANHNNGSNSGFTAPPAATINQTWGILRSSATAATFTQKLDSGNVASQNDTNAIFVDTDDVYFGLIVSSNSTTPSTLVITALRVRFEGDDHYTNIDLSQTITGP